MRITVHDVEIKNLIRLANDAKERAYAPYSTYKVGACMKGSSGAYYLGCSVECASYAASACAERVAIYKALSERERAFEVLTIISDNDQPAVPCGVCLQVLAELCEPGMPIICANRNGKYHIYYLGDLLPQAFSGGDMQ